MTEGAGRVAVLYDIHGNLPALEAVLAELRRAGADEVVVGGDVVPGPMPAGTVEALLELPVPVRFIRGNGEQDVLAVAAGEEPERVPEGFRPLLRWVADALPPSLLEVMAGWPPTHRLRQAGVGEILVCHATPRDDSELVTEVTPAERMRPVFEAPGADLVLCGHTHMPFDRRVGTVRVVNPGSVGMPFGRPGAYWALLDGEVRLRRTSYDLDAAEARIRATGFPGIEQFRLHDPPDARAMRDAFEAAGLR